MKASKLILILALAILIGGGAIYMFNQQEQAVVDQEFGQPFLAGLSNKINDVSRVVVQDDSMTVNLIKADDGWVVEEKSGYAADFSKVKQLLVTLAEMETIESKTSRPESYGRLGVQGVGVQGDESSKQIKLLDKADNMLYSVIVGKAKQATGQGAKSALYVRQDNEETSWLVTGAVRPPFTLNDWLDKSIIDLKRSRIQSVVIKHADNTNLTIARANKEATDFAIEDQPDGTKVKSISTVNNIAGGLQNLTLDDVFVRGKFEIDEKEINTAEFKTFDDLLVTAKLAKKDEANYIWFDVKTLGDDEAIRTEAQELNRNFALWVYQIPDFKATNMLKQMNDLIEKVAAEEATN